MEEKHVSTQNGEEITTEETVKKKGWSCLFVIFLAVLILVLIFAGKWFNSYSKTNKTGEQIVKLLDKKYNRKFELKSGKYIWATGNYQFKVYPKDDPEFVFDSFIGSMYSTGVGDTYLLIKRSIETEKLIKTYIDSISKNCFFTAGTGTDNKSILSDIHKKNLSVLQILKKYPYEMNFSTHVDYALKVNKNNKNKIMKSVYNLIIFLKEKKFDGIKIYINFYNPEAIKGLDIKKDYKKIWSKYWRNIEYKILIKPKDIKEIKNYKDIYQLLKKTNFK